jgi:hypothetical protein
MVIALVLLIPVLFISFLILAQVLLVINTEKRIYGIRFGRILSCRLIQKNNSLYVRLRCLFLSFYFNMKNKQGKISGSGPDRSVSTKKRSKNIRRYMNLFSALRKSVKIIRLKANIDTGDFPFNAQLYPVARLISRQNVSVAINFEDINQLDCLIQTRFITIIWNYIFNHNTY